MRNEKSRAASGDAPHSKRLLAVVAASLAVGTAVVVQARARAAERRYPPSGRFVYVDGTRLHYIEKGTGRPIVLLHGNGARAEDFIGSGVLERLAQRYRVVAIDRPGFGFSERPKGRLWTAQAQAAIISKVLDRLGVERPVVVGHSWGTLVALALALDHPQRIGGLALLSGYYYPTLRPDPLLMSGPAIPLIGTLMRNTVSPIFGRLIMPLVLKHSFAPQSVPESFLSAVPTPLALRPWQLRAGAQEAALMIPTAASFARRYGELRMPVAIVAGSEDHLVRPARHSQKLHQELAHSELHVLPGLGHMLHYAAPDAVASAIESVARQAEPAMARAA